MNGTTLEAKSKIIESSWTKLNHGGDRMTIEEILAGESKNVEFKVQRPDKSMKYMKTLVAFVFGFGAFLSTLSLRRATAKVHKTVGHFCAYVTNFMGIASSC